jgi:adenylate cyclase
MDSPWNAFPPDRHCFGACVITDAERYTSVAESVDPGEAVEFINRYLQVLFKPVYDNGGVVADVRGDGMLAVWAETAPSAELRARVCRACLQIAADSERFFPTRIGAYYGPIALATVGTAAHREYRAVGDTVNTASRLEALNKQLGTRVLVSASLAEGLGGFRFRDLGEVELRGKRNPVHVLELLYKSRSLTGAPPSSKSTSIQTSPAAAGATETTAKLAHPALASPS